jgi:hypothetical protein
MRRHSDLNVLLILRPKAQRFDPRQERLNVGVTEAALTIGGRAILAVPAVAVIGGWD